jgi:hypothetical protein
MVAYGIDEAWARLTPAQVRAAGKDFVIGYVGQDTTGKNITKSEVDAYRAAGVAVLLVYEYSATAVHGGASAGTTDADLAVRQAQALGYPQGCAIAFAADEDTSANPSIVDAYARAFTARVHAAGYRSMVYGGLATVRRCADLRLTDLQWQTYAWSGTPTTWDPRAAIRQVQNGVTIAGADVDLDTAMTADYGAWAPGFGGDTLSTAAESQVQSVFQAVFAGGSDCGAGTPIKANPDLGDTGGNSLIDKLDYLLQLAQHGQAVTLTDAQIAALIAAMPKPADVAAHLDYAALAAAIAAHVKVS